MASSGSLELLSTRNDQPSAECSKHMMSMIQDALRTAEIQEMFKTMFQEAAADMLKVRFQNLCRRDHEIASHVNNLVERMESAIESLRAPHPASQHCTSELYSRASSSHEPMSHSISEPDEFRRPALKPERRIPTKGCNSMDDLHKAHGAEILRRAGLDGTPRSRAQKVATRVQDSSAADGSIGVVPGSNMSPSSSSREAPSRHSTEAWVASEGPPPRRVSTSLPARREGQRGKQRRKTVSGWVRHLFQQKSDEEQS